MRTLSLYIAKYLFIFFIFFISLYILIWLSSSFVSKYFAADYLAQHNLTLSDSTSIRYNPFLSRLSIQDLLISKPDNTKTLQLDKLNLQLTLSQAIFSKLTVSQFEISGLYLKMARAKDKLEVAGISLPQENKNEEKEKTESGSIKDSSDWQFVLPKLLIQQAHFDLNINNSQHNYNITKLQIDDLLASVQKQSLTMTLDSLFDNANLAAKIQIELDNGLGDISSSLKLNGLDLIKYKAFLPEKITSLHGQTSLKSQQKIKLTKETIAIHIPELDINNTNLALSQEGLKVELKQQDLKFSNSTIDISGDKKKDIKLTTAVTQLNNQGLNLIQEGLTLSLNKQALDLSQLSLTLSANETLTTQQDTHLDIKKLGLNNEGLQVQQKEQDINLAKQTVKAENINLALIAQQAPSISSLVDLSLQGLAVTKDQVEPPEDTQGYPLQILTLSDLAVNKIEFKMSNEQPQARVEEITLSKLNFSDDIKDELPALASVDSLQIIQIESSLNALSIDKINLGEFKVDAILDENKALANFISLTEAETKENKAETSNKETSTNEVSKTDDENTNKQEKEPQPEKQAFDIKLNKFMLTADSRIDFVDNSVSPIYKRNIIVKTFEVGPLDTQKPEQQSLFKLLGRSNEYAHFELTGHASPYAKLPIYHAKGFFKEVSLPGISTYIKEALQYELQSGQLDLSLDVTLTGPEIDGNTNILLRGIQLTAADDHEAGTVKDTTSVPFNIAIGMLKDSDGNVDLDVPLSGNTSEPSFGVAGFITLLAKQAAISAAKDYLLTTFVPYANVVYIAVAAGEFALKVRFNDLVYPAQQSQLPEAEKVFLSQFAALMKDKPDTQVKLCAIATPADLLKPIGQEVTDKTDIEQLKQLSLQRSKNFKQHMVEVEKIESARLIMCTPQIDSGEDAKPRLSFET